MSAIEPQPEALVALTAEQVAFLSDCNADFKDRYTEKDSEFMVVKGLTINTPPMVDPWYNKPRRNFDWADRGGRSESSGDSGRSSNDRWEHNRQGGGYRQHRQNQGNYHPGGHQPQRQGDRFNQPRYRPY